MQTVMNAARTLLKHFDIGITRYSTLERLRRGERSAHDLELILTLPNEDRVNYLQYLEKSKSQLRQDLFVLSQLHFKTGGFFVEFGATNGVDLSNTWLLEKEFGWNGILAEPARCWHTDLTKNRTARIETSCVWKDSSSTLSFNEVDDPELSTLDRFSNFDLHKHSRKQGKNYNVNTISLNDLLTKHGAPKVIDFLSIDTEGSEFEILNSFDFSRHSFHVITCEHNFTPHRARVFNLLSQNGYRRVHMEMSQFDDWYVKSH